MEKEPSERAELTFKPAFIERYSLLTDWKEFATSCATFLRRSIRVNTLKIEVDEILQRMENGVFLPIQLLLRLFFTINSDHRFRS